jgi:hypothetical protein
MNRRGTGLRGRFTRDLCWNSVRCWCMQLFSNGNGKVKEGDKVAEGARNPPQGAGRGSQQAHGEPTGETLTQAHYTLHEVSSIVHSSWGMVLSALH